MANHGKVRPGHVHPNRGCEAVRTVKQITYEVYIVGDVKAKAIASDGGSKSLCFLCSTCPAKAGQVPLCSAPLVPIAKNLPHTEQAEPKNGRLWVGLLFLIKYYIYTYTYL